MNKNVKWVKWVLLALVLFLGLASVLLKPLPRSKARSQRVQMVNNISSFSVTMPLTNAPATVPQH